MSDNLILSVVVSGASDVYAVSSAMHHNEQARKKAVHTAIN